MLNFDQQFNVPIKLNNIQRFHKKIIGLNPKNNYELLEVDMANRCINATKFHENSIQNFSPTKSPSKSPKKINFLEDMGEIRFAKNLRTYFGKGYYYILGNRIEFQNSNIVVESNSKARFEGLSQGSLLNYGCIDGLDEYLIFVKYHLNFQKYSINLLKMGEQKKIIHLFDEPIANVHMPPCKDRVLYQDDKNTVGVIFGEKYNKNVILKQNSHLLYDDNYSYIAQLKKQHFKSEYLIRGYASNDFGLQNKNYSFEFILNDKYHPIRMDSFKNDILIATSNCLRIFDIRKLVVPYHQESRKEISDFYYDPNLQKIYVSSNSGLFVYKYT